MDVEPLDGDMIYHVTKTTTTAVSASNIDYKGTPLAPTLAPEGILGGTDYYKFRDTDFKIRNALMKEGEQSPDYYLSYGDKYANRFAYETKPQLSLVGQRWVDETLNNLQNSIEDRLKQDDGREFEKSNDFSKFILDTHPKAYLEAGLSKLGTGDLFKVLFTPDLKDMKGKQIFKVMGPLFKQWESNDNLGGIRSFLNTNLPQWIKDLDQQ